MIVPGVATAVRVGWSVYERFPSQLITIRALESIKLRLLI